jgi:predicted nucleic acid-binding protein
MVLADTSVWIGHFRKGDSLLAELLSDGSVLMHPFILGELACGNLKNRAAVLNDLKALPPAHSATHEESLSFIERHKLWGRGIGWIDAHLLASVLLSHCEFWTLDGRLAAVALHAGLRLHPAR